MISVFQDHLNDMKAKYHSRLGEKQMLEANIATLQNQVTIARAQQDKNNQISALLQKAAEVSRGNTKAHLENVCTMALKYVFDKDLEFVIDIQESRGRPEAEFFVQYTDGTDTIKVKPEDASGGGIIDVLSASLRFAFLELINDPKIQGPILLDEPGKMVSEVAANKMASLLRELKNTFGRQTIMSTHSDTYGAVADKEFHVMMNGNSSKVVEASTLQVASIADLQEEVEVDAEDIQ